MNVDKIHDTESFIKKAKEIWGNLYDYSKSVYTKSSEKLIVICKKHGEFNVSPNNHTHKDSPRGCPVCKESSLEKTLSLELVKLGINFERRFIADWSNRKSYDFILPNIGILIECQGEQHLGLVDFFGGKEKFNKQVENDVIKNELALKHDYKLMYLFKNENDIEKAISSNKIYNKDNCFTINRLIEEIRLFNINVDKICEELIWYGKKNDNGKYEIYIVIDFDFTITKESSWQKGTFTENDHCIETMHKWEKEYGVKFILETMRGEKHIQPALDFCKSKGIEFFGVGRNPLQDSDGDLSCKCWGVFDIDDRNCMIPLKYPKNGRPYVNWEMLDIYMSPILRKICKRLEEVEERVLEAKRLAHEENKFVEIDYSY